MFADKEVRYIGETIGLIVGPDKKRCIELANLVNVEYEEYHKPGQIDDRPILLADNVVDRPIKNTGEQAAGSVNVAKRLGETDVGSISE